MWCFKLFGNLWWPSGGEEGKDGTEETNHTKRLVGTLTKMSHEIHNQRP